MTAEHAKPRCPLPTAIAHRFRSDNLFNSKISPIYCSRSTSPSLIAHIETAWAPWFADTQGQIKVLLPRSNTLGGQYKGTADAVYQHLDLLQAHSPDLVAVFASDHIYRMDVRQMAAFHRSRDAEATIAAMLRRAGVRLRHPSEGRCRVRDFR